MSRRTQFCLTWEDVTISLDVFDHALSIKIGHFLSINPERRVSRGDCDIALRRGPLNTYDLDFDGKTWSFDTLDDLLLHAITFASLTFLRNTHHLVLHAGAILLNGDAVLFSGAARMGKSHFALTAWELGLKIIGDDWVAIDCTEGVVMPFPKPLKPRMNFSDIGEDTRFTISESDYVSGSLNGEHRLVLSRRLHNIVTYREHSRIAELLFLERDSEHCHVSALRGTAAIQRILDQVMRTQSPSKLKILRPFQTLIRTEKVSVLKIPEHGSKEAIQMLTSRTRPS